MKKLVISACAMALAVVANAANVVWGSGALYTATSKDGGWSSTLVNAAEPPAVVTMSVFLVDADTYSTVGAKDQQGIYDWASTQTADYSGQNKNAAGTVIGAATVTVANTLAASSTYYSVIVAEYKDATYGDMFMATTATVNTTAAGAGSVATLFGGASTAAVGGVRNWQAAPIPEPTSGLLLLLGMAGLALKRKRA